MPMADRSVTFRFFSPKSSRRFSPNPARSFLTAPSGRAAIRRPFPAAGADVIGLDRDPNAISGGQGAGQGVRWAADPHPFALFRACRTCAGRRLDGVVLDIGVSSMQIDEAERGFSFQKNGPLDMRMSASGVSAADVVNRAKASDLIRIFGFLGEEKHRPRHREGA